MKKALILLSAVLLIAVMAIPALAEFDLEDFTLPESGVHFGFNGDAKADGDILTGELVGDPTFVEGRDGTANGAVYLDDSEQYIFLGKYVDAENYTASFWAKVEDNTEHVFLCSSILGSIRIIHDGGVVVGNTINGVVDNLSEYSAPRDEWVNMTFVYTGAEEKMDIYANGELVGTLNGALPLPFTLLGNEAAEQKGWQSYPFLTLDDAWFFPRAFTADEVVALYNGEDVGGAAAPAGDAPKAAETAPTLLWDFNEDETMSEDMGANSNNAVSFWGEKDEAGNDYYVFVAGGNDPYVSVDLDAEDVSDIVWAKARVKNPGPATAIELFGHTNNRGLTGSECTHINVAADNEWHTYVIYIPEENVKTVNAYKDPQYAITDPYWEGTVEWIRLDPMWQEGNDGSDAGGSMTSGDEIYIDYIAFFPTEEAAKAFRADQDAAAEVAGTPTVANGTPTFSTNYQIPKAPAAPAIDGVKSAGEWDNALIMRINRNSMYPGGLPEAETPPDATFYYMWSDEGLYFFANVLDSTEPFTIHDPGAGSYNSGDGVQLNVYPDTEITGGTAGLIYFWSLVVNSEGTASVGEHFIFSDGSSGADVPEVQAACTKDGFNYTIEAFFPASVWTGSDPAIEFKEGTTFGMTNVVMEDDEGAQTLMCDSAWFNENNEINTYTFVGEKAAAAEPEPEPEPEPTYTYPASGAEGSVINGTVIGNETGWGDNADAGAAAAFDGNPATFFDPLGVGDGFCGIDAGESYILDKVVILSRDGWNDRFDGAKIQGSNDGENWETLWTSETVGTNPDYYTVTEFENNTGYSQFRYFNDKNHGDVAEVEFYGAPGKVEPEPEPEEPKTADPDEALDQKANPNTFDFGVIAAVASVVSLAGFAVSKKRH